MENSIVFVGDIDYSERLQNVKLESDLDGGSTSSIFGSVLRETVTVIIYDEIEHADTLTLKFEIGDEVKDYGVFKVDKIEYDDKTTLTTVEAYSDISDLLEEFEMPNAKSTDELLEKLGLPKAPINYPIKDTSDKYYENKLKLLQDIAALTGSYVKVSPKVEFVQPSKPKNLIKNGWDDFEAYGFGELLGKAPIEVLKDGYKRNYLLDSGTSITTSSYAIKDYAIAEDIRDGEIVTISMKAELGEDRSNFEVYNSGGFVGLVALGNAHVHDGVYTRTFKWKVGSSSNKFLRVYQLTASGTSESTIHWIMLQKGDATTTWVPAWEDLPKGDKPVDVYEEGYIYKQPLKNGLTRIQTWGGNKDVKLRSPLLPRDITKNISFYVDAISGLRIWDRWSREGDKVVQENFVGPLTVPVAKPAPRTYVQIPNVKDVTASLDFIASDPVIVEGDEYLPEHVSFELEPGEWLEPVSEVHLTTPYGENESDGEEGSGLNFSEIELIKDIKPQILPKLLELYQGFTYRKYESKHPGDPFTRPGDFILTIDKDSRPHEIFVTSRTFIDNGGWSMDISSDIPSQEEVTTSYIGTFEKVTKIEVDKVNHEIDALVQGWDDVSDQLAQINIEMQEIFLKVMNLNTNENIIPNFNGGSKSYYLWEWDNPATTLKNFENVEYLDGITSSTNFIITEIRDSVSRWGLRFFASGNATTGFARVVPNTKYSYRGKAYGNHNVVLKVLEYDSLYGNILNTTSFTLKGEGYHEFSMNFNPDTEYVRIRYEIPSTVSTSNPWTVTEQMFNRDNPKEWHESAADVKLFAEAQIRVLDNEIISTVEEVKLIEGEVEQSKLDISQMAGELDVKVSKDGIIGGINASPERVKIKSNRLEFDNAVGENVTLSGDIRAVKGLFGGFTISGDELVGISSGKRVVLNPSYILFGPEGGSSRKSIITYNDTELSFDVGGAAGIVREFIKIESPGLRVDVEGAILGGVKIMSGGITSTGVYPQPEETGSQNLGGAYGNYRWANIYLKNQPNVSSDIRLKSAIKDIPDELIYRMSKLKPKQYVQDGKVHFGYIAQDVERELYKYCVDEYGWENAQKAMEQYAFLYKSESHLSLLYGEITVLKDAMVDKRLEELENGNGRNISNRKVVRGVKSKRLRNRYAEGKIGGVRE